MSLKKATPSEIYAMQEEQKKLNDLQKRLAGVLSKVKESINSITVENIQLTSYQIDAFEREETINKPEPIEKPPVVKVEIQPVKPEPQLQFQTINQQLIDLEIQTSSHYDLESDEEIDDL